MRKVLITGATSGIGEDFAHYYAHRGYECHLLGRNIMKLQELSEHYLGKAEIVTYAVDLSDSEQLHQFCEQITDIPFDIVINNAGFGLMGEFHTADLDVLQAMIDTNVSALTQISHVALNSMVHQNKGYLLNVASVAAFTPGPLMSVYYATKAYVHSLTQALAKEMKPYNVTVSAVYPGPIKTEFGKRAQVKNDNPLASVATHSSQELVYRTIKAMNREKKMIIPFKTDKVLHIVTKLLPTWCVVNGVHWIQKQMSKGESNE